MTDTVSFVGLLTSLVLPWVVGSIWTWLLLKRSSRRNIFLILGHGYLLGIFVTSIAIRLWDGVGLPLNFWGIVAVLTGLSVAGLLTLRTTAIPTTGATKFPPLEKWQLAVITAIAALIAYRYATMSQELLLRPLYAWDAWMNWMPKAVIWFHDSALTPFISPQAWLAQTGEPTSHTLGAGNAWRNPITIPLIQLWGMLGAQSSDHTMINLPWIMVILALGMALYGHLRLAGISVLWATLACYVLLNMPYVNVQTVLAGYADIWLAATFGCATFALLEWSHTRQWPYALLALILALMCAQLKIPGLVLCGIVLLVFTGTLINPGRKTIIFALLALAMCAIFILTIGVDISIGGIGRIVLSQSTTQLPYIGRFNLEYHPITTAMADTLFLMLNWNMLWYLFVMVALLLAVRTRRPGWGSPDFQALLLALLFIFPVYYFTDRYQFAVDFTQVNRALIYCVPVMVFFLFRSLWSLRQSQPGQAHADAING